MLGSEQPLNASELEAERADVARLLQRPEGPDALPSAPVQLEEEEVPTGVEALESQIQPVEEEEELQQGEASELAEEGEAEKEWASAQHEGEEIVNEAKQQVLEQATEEPAETEVPPEEQ